MTRNKFPTLAHPSRDPRNSFETNSEILGTGSFGTVSRTIGVLDKRPIAVKTMFIEGDRKADIKEQVRRIKAEIRIRASLPFSTFCHTR